MFKQEKKGLENLRPRNHFTHDMKYFHHHDYHSPDHRHHRAFESLSIELNIIQSFQEIYEQYSQLFENYLSKLYGPQEEELGEKNMNIIRFAKDVRSRKHELMETAKNSSDLQRYDLIKCCRQLGLEECMI